MRAITAFCAAFLLASAGQAETSWSRFVFQEKADPLTDEVSWAVGVSRNDRNKIGVVFICDPTVTLERLSLVIAVADGKFRFRTGTTFTDVQVRFDKQSVRTMEGVLSKDGTTAFITDRSGVLAIIEGWRSNTSMVAKIGNGTTMVIPLRGSTTPGSTATGS